MNLKLIAILLALAFGAVLIGGTVCLAHSHATHSCCSNNNSGCSMESVQSDQTVAPAKSFNHSTPAAGCTLHSSTHLIPNQTNCLLRPKLPNYLSLIRDLNPNTAPPIA